MVQAENKKQLYHQIIYGIFLVLFLLEPLVKIFHDTSYNVRAKAIVKIALLVIMLSFVFFFKIKKEILLFLVPLIFFFLIGQYMLVEKYSIFGGDLLNEVKRGDIYIAIKYLYILIFVAAYEKITDNDKLTERLVNLFIGFMIINTIFIGIGLITKWELLKSYPYSSRVGYHGLIELAGESIHLYIIAISLAYIIYIKSKKFSLLLLFILGGILLGKKGMFLYLLLLGLIHLVYFKKKKLLYGLGGLTIILFVFHKQIIEALLEIFPFWQALYEEKGLATIIFSKRDILFNQSIDYIQNNWHLLNYMFGGIDFLSYRSEFGFFDLFLAFGFLGLLVYLWFMYKNFLSKQSILVKTIFIVIFITEAFTGGLLINVTPMIFLYLVAKYLEKNYKITQNEKFENVLNSNSTPR